MELFQSEDDRAEVAKLQHDIHVRFTDIILCHFVLTSAFDDRFFLKKLRMILLKSIGLYLKTAIGFQYAHELKLKSTVNNIVPRWTP
jgi:hypothetical protein